MSFVNTLAAISVAFKQYFLLSEEAETLTLQWEYKAQTYNDETL